MEAWLKVWAPSVDFQMSIPTAMTVVRIRRMDRDVVRVPSLPARVVRFVAELPARAEIGGAQQPGEVVRPENLETVPDAREHEIRIGRGHAELDLAPELSRDPAARDLRPRLAAVRRAVDAAPGALQVTAAHERDVRMGRVQHEVHGHHHVVLS